MKKTIIYIILLMLFPISIIAQSSMTDEQVMQFVLKEHEAGTSQSQIVTKLMQNGVDISQIRRVRTKYERQINDKGMGVVADETASKAESRMRKNNGKRDKSNNGNLSTIDKSKN